MPQVNINLDEQTANELDRMAALDGFDNRSAFVRRLIRLEAQRRRVTFEAGPHAPTEQLHELAAADA